MFTDAIILAVAPKRGIAGVIAFHLRVGTACAGE